MTEAAPSGSSFDHSFDVVVVGYGFAGGAAAIAAADAGASVLLVEKMPQPGGISITAGGGIRATDDADAAFAYLQATNDGRTDDASLRMIADGMAATPAMLRALGTINDAEIVVRDFPGNYPYPGSDSLKMIDVLSIPGFDAAVDYPHAKGLKGGPNVFKVVEDNIKARKAITVWLDSPAKRLLRGPNGDVTGLTVEHEGIIVRIEAKGGVVLAAGGFENAPDIQQQFWQLKPVLSAAAPGNTGDGLRMAMSAGADLWHMWHFHGSYGFRHPDPALPNVAIRMKRMPDWRPAGSTDPGDKARVAPMCWIVVDRDGQRYMNEYPPYVQDTGHRMMDAYDPAAQRFPRVPSWIVFDDDGRQMYPIGQPVFSDPSTIYEWSLDNTKEVANGMLLKGETLGELAAQMGMSGNALTQTMADWNAVVAAGEDPMGRPKAALVPVAKPPFYAGQIWPVISNTQGGPRHDPRQQVLNPFDEPVAGLYVAGELGSIWGSLYLVGGNLAECFITGDIAGREAAGQA